jgi:hypothetical protein
MGGKKMVEALRPFDLEEHNLAEYKNLDPRWSNWQTVRAVCADYATLMFDHIVGLED